MKKRQKDKMGDEGGEGVKYLRKQNDTGAQRERERGLHSDKQAGGKTDIP